MAKAGGDGRSVHTITGSKNEERGTLFMEKMRSMTGATLNQWVSLWLWIFFLGVLSGCSQPISKKVMATVDRGRTFSVVIENPKAYIGSIVLWGGVIEKFVPGPEENRLVVIQCPVDNDGHPQTDETYGEFIAHTPDRLDPHVFRKGMMITLAGMVDGVEEEKLGPEKIPLPLVRVIEIHAWTEGGKRLRKR